jgi:hypothetical protein
MFTLCIFAGNYFGKPPMRAKAYIDTHKKKGGGYPNDEVKERVYGFYTLS